MKENEKLRVNEREKWREPAIERERDGEGGEQDWKGGGNGERGKEKRAMNNI